jgi:hypothetical protein
MRIDSAKLRPREKSVSNIDFEEINVDALKEERTIKKRSINITQEAVRMGKFPIEDIADNLENGVYHKRPDLISPRTKEILEVSSWIIKNFEEKGHPPKTTAAFYRAGKMLGRGAFGKVTLGMHKLSRKLVALKSINKEFMSDEK